MLFGLFSLTATAADDLTVVITGADGNPASVTLQDADGDGYYDIGNADELYAFAAAVNGGNYSINGELTADIVVNENVLDENGELNGDGSDFRVWTPIGNDYYSSYTGIFDGAEHTVSGLYFNDTEQYYVGLFGSIGDGATVKNVGVVDSYFNAKYYVGGVAGENYKGTITNCYNTGTVSGTKYVGGVVGDNNYSTITNCYNIGAVNGETYVGGVAGGNHGTIASCYSAGTVTGTENVGGVVGDNNYSTITNCYNTGAVNGETYVGGVVGNTRNGTFASCYSAGTVTGETSVGGVVGNVFEDIITNCYSAGTVTGETYVGGVAGENYKGTITNCYNTGAVTGEIDVGGVAGYTDDGTVASCYNTGTVTGTENVGGVVGHIEGSNTITNCYSTGALNGEGYYVGGVVGWNSNSTITNCYYLAGSAATGIGNDENADIKEVTEAQMKAASGEEGALVDMLNEWVEEQPNAEYIGWHLCSNGTSRYPNLKLICTYSDNGEKHVVECTLCGDETEEAHVGGTATCRGQECDKCGAWYGEVDKTNHDETVNCYENGFCHYCGVYEPAVLVGGYYEIESVGQLLWFAEQVGSGNTSINGKLTADIVVNENVLDENGELNGDGSDFRVWTPIYNDYDKNPYTGIFDGAEHTVSGLYFNDTEQDYVGLFGYISGATVKNVGVVDSYFNAKKYVGGVVGYNDGGSVTNCYNTGAVNGEDYVGGIAGENYSSTITNCYSTGALNGEGYYVGGVVGYNFYSIITNCYNEGTVTGETYVGGVLGYSDWGAITNCYNAATVTGETYVGGVAGYTDSFEMNNCYNIGTVNGELSVGGVVGYTEGSNTITNCYNTGTVTGIDNVSGVVGCTEFLTMENCYNTGAVNGELSVGGVVGYIYYNSTITNCYYLAGTATGGIDGADEDGEVVAKTADEFASGEVAYLLQMAQTEQVWGQTLVGEGKEEYPVLGGATVYFGYKDCEDIPAIYANTPLYENKPEHNLDSNGFCNVCDGYEPATQNAEGVYEIGNAGQLYWFAEQVNGGNYSINGKLTADIVVNENVLDEGGALNGDGSNFRVWTPIGKSNNRYGGSFDGAEHTVSGLYVNNTEQNHVGLFGYISGATVKNVGVVDSYFNAKDYIGGVVGYNYSNVTITNCYNTGAVNGEYFVGGVAGENYECTITNCYNTGTVTGTYGYVGGIAGINFGAIMNCYNTGAVNGEDHVGGVVGWNNNSTITNCYNTGAVNGEDYVGGVAGYNSNNSTITNCYNTGAVNGEDYVGGVAGYNSNNSTITNCYYLAGAATGGINGADEGGKAVAKTADEFASGEVAYLLQMDQTEQVWGQTLAGEGKDAYPVLGGERIYYGYISCAADAVMVYTNDEAASAEKLDHDMAEATCTVPSTCKREGCGHTEGTVNENAHAWNEGAVTTNPTCSAVGKKTFTCTHNSAHTYTEDVAIDENAHAWNEGAVTTNPTCSAVGTKTYTCTHNSAHTKTEDVAIDENAHAWNEGAVTTNPTCSAVGTKTYTCTHNSAHTYTEDVAIDENAHAWNEGVVTTDPTCTEKGVKTFTCAHNSEHTYTEDVDALGHKYDNACDATCNTCGEERTPAEHIDADENHACDECGAELPKDGLSGGAIAGIVIGSLLILGGGGFALWWFVFRKKRII